MMAVKPKYVEAN